MQFFESIRWAPRCAAPPNRCGVLWRFRNDRSEFLVRRHTLSSHEHIDMSRSNSAVGKALRLPIKQRTSGAHAQHSAALADGAGGGKINRQLFRRGGRAVDRAGLENRKAERPR